MKLAVSRCSWLHCAEIVSFLQVDLWSIGCCIAFGIPMNDMNSNPDTEGSNRVSQVKPANPGLVRRIRRSVKLWFSPKWVREYEKIRSKKG
jgi:hypothetical protein